MRKGKRKGDVNANLSHNKMHPQTQTLISQKCKVCKDSKSHSLSSLLKILGVFYLHHIRQKMCP